MVLEDAGVTGAEVGTGVGTTVGENVGEKVGLTEGVNVGAKKVTNTAGLNSAAMVTAGSKGELCDSASPNEPAAMAWVIVF